MESGLLNPKKRETLAMTEWIVRPRRRPACQLRLFCFPYAGVGPSAYRGWADELNTDIETCLIHLPGRESRLREKPLTSVKEIAYRAAVELEPSLDRPYALFGHSLGAVIAFETLRCLRARGSRMPEVLFVSASRAPHLSWPHPPVGGLPDKELLHEIHRRYQSVPTQVMHSAELQELLVPSLRADLGALESYLYETFPPFDVPIRVFGGTADSMVPRDALERWRDHTSASFHLRMFEGNHLFLHTAKQQLIQTVSMELQQLGAASTVEMNKSQFRSEQVTR